MRDRRHMGDRADSIGLREAALAFGLGGLFFLIGLLPATTAQADVACPNPIPVVNENQCKTGTTSWRIDEASANLGGFTTRTSVDLGESVVLKIGRDGPVAPTKTVNIAIYRMGYYDGLGGRLVNSASNVPINNDYACKQMDQTTGLVDCDNWSPTYTIPGSSLPASGIYLAKLTASTGDETQVVFTVRDDDRQPESKMLYVLPIATYEAYNVFGGKSLYYGTEGDNTVSGTGRAVKVSFNRPFNRAGGSHDWFLGPDFDLLSWLEQQGYDVSYTDDVQAHLDAAELRQHDALVITGHSEYWSLQHFNAIKAARDAGVNIASFSANTAYWKVRYEDGARTLVCYKTVEGSGSAGSGTVSANDWGPDGLQNTADDALGLDGKAGTADDNPQNSTTTFRDNGAPPGDPSAPPGGRVGPDMPENQLFGVMYVGDNDARGFPVTVTPGNSNEEFAADRIWRNTGISGNSTTDIGTLLVNWEWDAIPTQAQYLSRQPSGVKRLSATNVQTVNDNSWLQDEGRLRNTVPPPGQPGTVNAVKYTAPSGALVFATGTIQWAYGLSGVSDDRIQQATYNVFSDMGVQPDTPAGVSLDPGGSNQAPHGSFTISPNPTKTATPVTFNAAASTDPNGTIVKYEWDLDGDGEFETSSGTKSSLTHSYTAEGEFDVRLRVTDNQGATDLAVRTLTIIDNQAPSASFTINPDVTVKGEAVGFNASGSKDPDGTIVKYEWDFDGNGSYETNAGASPTTTHTYAATGTFTVGLKVTDNGGKTATAALPVNVNSGEPSNYSATVLDTPGLVHYWRMGETSGPTFADSSGSSPATGAGGLTFGVPGGVQNDPDRAARFDGLDDSASAQVNLSGTQAVTVEFWMKRNFANDDHIAMELTGSYHDNPGGFLIDPNAPELGGKFAIGIGLGVSRNTAYFDRPSSGVWHHYAFVLNAAAPAAQQIVPYVDGEPVAFTKPESGTGAGNFANSTLYFMSRAAASLFGDGDLDEVAIYNRALSAATIDEHFNSDSTNHRPTATFQMPPITLPGQQVTFDASGSKDSDGTIVKYEWDLDGNGSYETDTGSTPTASRTYATEADITVGLRVTDNGGAAGTTTRLVSIGNNQPPTAHFTASPNPVPIGEPVGFNAAGSSDPNGTIVKYEWDFDGNGSYETNGGASPTTTQTYPIAGTYQVGLRVTDDGGKTATSVVPVVVEAVGVHDYASTVLDTPGLVHYWRMGDSPGPTLADSVGSAPASASGGAVFGVPGGLAGELDTATRFDGSNDAAAAALKLSGKTALTIEFWMKWGAWANDDDLALEYTSNFNDVPGGFLIDPNSSFGTFGVALGIGASRNVALFSRPSAGQWHHYAFVLDTTAPAAQQVVPYVDGLPVAFTKAANGTGAAPFANASLFFMSRAATALFGAGDLDEVAIYDRSLNATTIAEHYQGLVSNHRPVAAFQAPGSATLGQQVTFDASGSKDSDGTIVKYEWDLDGNGSYETDTGTVATASRTYATEADITVGLRVTDNHGATGTASRTLSVVGNQPPTSALTAAPNPALVDQLVTFDASGSKDPDGTIVKYEWDLDGNGSYETDSGSTPTASRTYAAPGTVTVAVRATDNQGKSATSTLPVTINLSGVSNYGDAVLDTEGLVHYWRMGETSGPTFADSIGTTAATAAGGTVFGVPGAVTGDPNLAASFDGVDDTASAPVDLSATHAVTVEFWMKWNSWTNDDRLAMEFTNNFNDLPGGFLIDPSAPQLTGTFAVGIGSGLTRNNAFFARPSAGQWHHYAFVLDASAPAASQITPYIDGAVVPYLKLDSGTGAGNFASSTLHMMSRAGASLFGAGSLDEVAIYDRALDAATIVEHSQSFGTNRRPVASFQAPASTSLGQQVIFDASGSSDPDGTIAKYEWDLDGNGSFETDTGTTPTTSHTYSTVGDIAVRLRVTDDSGAIDQATRTLSVVDGQPLTASFEVAPNPAFVATQVGFDASASNDPDSSIVKYEWDLDGNGSYETDTGTVATASRTYLATGTVAVGLRVTNAGGETKTASRTLIVKGGGPASYADAVLGTSGLISYWRLGDASGPTLADSAGSSPATASGGPTLGVPAGVPADSDTAAHFDGVDDAATVALDLSEKTAVTIEFWMKWSAWANDDRLAFEFTPNFNDVPGGFLVDPNSSFGNFAVAIGQGASRNVALFARPSAGQWHHYAFVLDTAAPAAQQVLPYVDGQPVAFTKTASGTGAGPFANDSLAFMSRAGSALFGDGDLDEVAVYGRALDAATIAQQFALTIQNSPPVASFGASPNPAQTGTAVGFNAAGSSDSDGTIAKYEWDLDGNGSYETDTGNTPTASRTYASAGDRGVGLRVTDDSGASTTTTRTVTIQNRAPAASFMASPNPALSGVSVSFDAAGSSDPDGTIAKYEWDLDGNGSYETDSGATASASGAYASAGDRQVGLRVTDDNGAIATTTRTVTVQNRAPTASFTAAPNPALTGVAVAFNAAASSDPDGTIAKYEWDLDGNGSYETDTGTTATATQSFATSGDRIVGLRITDDNGATATTTRTVTVQNRAPTASFTATPNPVETSTNTALNAGASKDPDGTIVKYEWDLDTNGSYETNTGATASATSAYATVGNRVVGLRVTDNNGATATTTQTVTVINHVPNPSFTVTPNPVLSASNAILNAGASSDPDGTVTKYEWDLDGNGSYETSTGTTATATATYATAGNRTIGLRITDNLGATATTTRTVTVTNRAPTASFTASPNPVLTGATVTFNGTGSTDPDGTLAKYEWDFDGNGSYETNTGTTATTTKSFTPAGARTIGLRVTDNNGATATTTQTVTVRGPYNTAVSSTAGLIDYWRLGETSGTTLADSVGGLNATAKNGVTLGSAGNLTLDSNTAASFDGSNDSAAVALNLSATPRLTIEFWLKWNTNANDDDLAFEFTSNFNNTNGGFLINPNSSTSGGKFEIALGRAGTRNNAYFTRPSAGVWHHYAIVLDATAAASQQILPYVDGQAVSITKGSSGTGAGNFANSTLNFMSRNGSSLFGRGVLDEVAIYNQALTGPQISQHFAAR